MITPSRWMRGMVLVSLLVSACGPPPAPPGPGEASGFVPDLRGYTVMVFPVQLQSGVPQGVEPDLEIAHTLGSFGDGVSWVFPSDMENMLARSPSVHAQIRGLPVQAFLQAEVNRVGEPLYGHIVRMSGLTGADVALLPVEVKYGPDGTYLISAALVAARNARVTWYGVVEGATGDAANPGTMASAAESLAGAILPYR